MKIEVFTDGSSLNNGKPNCVGGWSCVFFMNNKTYVRYGNLPAQSSNNKGEIYGVLYAIHTLQAKKDWKLQIYSDSQYVVKAINEWRFAWANRGYMDVKNMELFEPLFDAWDAHRNAKIAWVRGHAGNKGNELADEYAGYGMRNINKTLTNELIDVRIVNNWLF